MKYNPVMFNTPEEVMAITKAWLEGKPLEMQAQSPTPRSATRR